MGACYSYCYETKCIECGVNIGQDNLVEKAAAVIINFLLQIYANSILC